MCEKYNGSRDNDNSGGGGGGGGCAGKEERELGGRDEETATVAEYACARNWRTWRRKKSKCERGVLQRAAPRVAIGDGTDAETGGADSTVHVVVVIIITITSTCVGASQMQTSVCAG